jgi:hypothetical protein
MRRWRAGLAGTGVGLLLLALSGGWLTWGPRPVVRFEVLLDGSEDMAEPVRLSFESPAWMLIDSQSRANLRLEPVVAAAPVEVRRMWSAELHAPGFRVEPDGAQLVPAAGPVGFGWTVRAEEAGVLEWRPETSVRDPADDRAATDRLLWSKSVPVRVVAPAGLGARSLGLGSALSAILALAAGVAWRLAR